MKQADTSLTEVARIMQPAASSRLWNELRHRFCAYVNAWIFFDRAVEFNESLESRQSNPPNCNQCEQSVLNKVNTEGCKCFYNENQFYLKQR